MNDENFWKDILPKALNKVPFAVAILYSKEFELKFANDTFWNWNIDHKNKSKKLSDIFSQMEFGILTDNLKEGEIAEVKKYIRSDRKKMAIKYFLLNILPEDDIYILVGEDQSALVKLNATLDYYINMFEANKNK